MEYLEDEALAEDWAVFARFLQLAALLQGHFQTQGFLDRATADGVANANTILLGRIWDLKRQFVLR